MIAITLDNFQQVVVEESKKQASASLFLGRANP
jgi:hypothetical protein